MFIGEYKHILDEKRRISLPSKFRQGIVSNEIMITKGEDCNLALYPLDEFDKVSRETTSLFKKDRQTSRNFKRFVYAGAARVGIDSAGRILIPENLAMFANLKEKIVLAGVENLIELWNESEWEKRMSEIEKQTYEFDKNTDSE